MAAVGTALGDIDLGDVALPPPNLTVQHHSNPDGQVRPYLGAGVNYTRFLDADLPTGSALSTISCDSRFGLAAQGGIDVVVHGDWLFNLDVKHIASTRMC